MHPFSENFPFFCIMLCMLSAIVCAVLKGKSARVLALACLCACVGMSCALTVHTAQTGEAFVYTMGHFAAPWGNELRGGLLEALTALVFSLCMGGILLCEGERTERDIARGKVNLFYTMALLAHGALLALVYTNDLFTGYVFIEISTISACGLIMSREIGRTGVAAMKYLVMSSVGSGLILISLALLYDMTGHLLMVPMRASIESLVSSGNYNTALTVSVGMLTAGLAIKSGLFPFHTWMPDTYGYSTPAAGAVLSGLVSKGYIFFLIKLFVRVIGYEHVMATGVGRVLFVFGALGMVFGSVMAIRQKDSRTMVAYSSAAQIGYVYAALGVGTQEALGAALFHVFVHAVTKPMLFLSLGCLTDAEGGGKLIADIEGTGLKNRTAGLVFTLGALSMVGIPLTGGFSSKYLIAVSAADVGGLKAVLLLVTLAVSVILNAMYFMRTVLTVFRRNSAAPVAAGRVIGKNGTGVWLALGLFALMNVVLGVLAQTILGFITRGLSIFG